jgi:hypothetical protein
MMQAGCYLTKTNQPEMYTKLRHGLNSHKTEPMTVTRFLTYWQITISLKHNLWHVFHVSLPQPKLIPDETYAKNSCKENLC